MVEGERGYRRFCTQHYTYLLTLTNNRTKLYQSLVNRLIIVKSPLKVTSKLHQAATHVSL